MTKRIKLKSLIIIGLILLLMFYIMRFVSIFDENYTLLLVHHTFFQIINYDSLDVHPPLYYFLLKIFLDVTTFWTDSFLFKIIFARIFSLLISIITFTFLVKICKEISIKNSLLLEFIIFLSVPGVIDFTYELIKIRMYSLAALFVVIELYELIKYDKTNKNKYLLLSTCAIILSLYTNYYSGLVSGLLLFSYIVRDISNCNKLIKLVLSGTISLIVYLPWIPIFLKQVSLQNSHPLGGFSVQWAFSLFIILLFSYPLIKLNKNTYMYKCLVNMFIISVILLSLVSIFSIMYKPIIAFRYLYPCLLPYCFLSLNGYVKLIKSKGILNILLSMGVISFIILLCIGGYIHQICYYNISSINILKDCNRWDNERNKHIKLIPIKNKDEGFDMEKSIFLSDQGKYIIIPYTDKNNKYPNNMKMTNINKSYHKLFRHVNSHVVNY